MMTNLPARGLGPVLVLVAAGLAGCGTFDYTPDLAENELFYADVPFVT